MQPAIFLDRDGVIIENRSNYVRSWADVEFYPQAIEALASRITGAYKLIIITNQSPIGRGILTREQFDEINQRILREIDAAGVKVDGVYVCPHHPDDGCECRKPRPGMLLQAAREHQLDLDNSILVGDALSDLQAGIAAGVGRVMLVRTGRGAEQEKSSEAADMQPFEVYANLAEALSAIMD
jgi:D-glycero-D-manno-heptose 1,7-bisphosphate phosphatase